MKIPAKALRSRNLGEFWRVGQDETRTAFVDLRIPERPRVWSYLEFNAAIDAVARGFIRRGLGTGSRIAILSKNRAEFLQVYFGAMRAGLISVPINYKLPKETVEYIFKDASISMAFVDHERVEWCPPGPPLINFDETDGPRGFASFSDYGSFECFAPSAHDIGQVIYTSGSTGRPKGVLLSHAGQVWAVDVYASQDIDPPEHRALVAAPFYHMNGLFSATLELRNGGTIVSVPQFESRHFLETTVRYRCQTVGGVPPMFAMLSRAYADIGTNMDLSFVTLVSMGSAPLTLPVLTSARHMFPNARVENGYGSTEAGPAIFGDHPLGPSVPDLSVGYPLKAVEVKLVGESAPNQGELLVKTPALMEGYLNRPELKAERIIDGWFHTGDVMRKDENGFYFFVARVDDMFVCGGENVYPSDVEKMLERCDGVAHAVVVPATDMIKGQIPVAFIVRKPQSELTGDDLKKFSLEHGPAYAHPRLIAFLDAFPLSGTQKIDRARLKADAEKLVIATGERNAQPSERSI